MFLPLSSCCLEGSILKGDPAGVMEPATGGRRIARYHAKPQNGQTVNPKAAIVLFYDAFGFTIPNAKIIADAFAEQTGLHVFVPDYIPSPPPATITDGVLDAVPGENAGQGMFQNIFNWGRMIVKIMPYVPGVLTGRIAPLCTKAVEDLQAEGYEKLGGIGYCRGASMVAYLLSVPSPILSCGVLCHPAPDTKWWETITRPTVWHLADHDIGMKEPQIAQLKKTLGKKQGVEFECVVHAQTTHGFAARPTLTHEQTKKAFEAANESGVGFFKKHLVAV